MFTFVNEKILLIICSSNVSMRTLFVSLSILLLSGSLLAKDPVLMTINGNPVSKSEFEYIYNKNNSNNVLDKKTLEEYVDLFVNFKLKVEEAKTQGIDTTEAFINELKGYRDQLTRPYLTDTKAEEDALKEAYERLKEDVEVSHILIRVDQHAALKDTLAAWNKIRRYPKDCSMKTSAQLPKKHQKTSQQPTTAVMSDGSQDSAPSILSKPWHSTHRLVQSQVRYEQYLATT